MTPAQAALLTDELRRLRIAVEDAVDKAGMALDRIIVAISPVAH